MKTIKQDELFQNLGTFLKSKGVELKDGSYTQRIRQGCNLLSEAINATQKTVKTAKVEVDKKLDQLRQNIHEATAPTTPTAPPAAKTQPAGAKKEKKKPSTTKPPQKRPSASRKAPSKV